MKYGILSLFELDTVSTPKLVKLLKMATLELKLTFLLHLTVFHTFTTVIVTFKLFDTNKLYLYMYVVNLFDFKHILNILPTYLVLCILNTNTIYNIYKLIQ